MAETKKEKEKTEPEDRPVSQLYRSETNRVIAGVAGGLGEFFNIDPLIVRIVFILLSITGGSGLIIYVVLWLVIPSRSSRSKNPSETIRSNIEDMKSATQTFSHNISRPMDGKDNSKFWWAVIIIVAGFLLLMNNFGLLEPLELEKLWPLFLIIFGLAVLLRK